MNSIEKNIHIYPSPIPPDHRPPHTPQQKREDPPYVGKENRPPYWKFSSFDPDTPLDSRQQRHTENAGLRKPGVISSRQKRS